MNDWKIAVGIVHAARHLLPIGLFMVLLIAMSGCRQAVGGVPAGTPAADIRVTLAYEPDPAAVGEAVLLVTVTDDAGTPITDATITARGDMDHAGMQPVDGTGEHTADGVYRVPFEWTMGGDWFVTITATRPDGSSAVQRFDLSVGS